MHHKDTRRRRPAGAETASAGGRRGVGSAQLAGPPPASQLDRE